MLVLYLIFSIGIYFIIIYTCIVTFLLFITKNIFTQNRYCVIFYTCLLKLLFFNLPMYNMDNMIKINIIYV